MAPFWCHEYHLKGYPEIGIERILSVSGRTGCSAYDSQYIALAEDLNLNLYTYDQAILSACKEMAMKPAKP